jgi:endothelin-converting enzyme/putative endopeptidase
MTAGTRGFLCLLALPLLALPACTKPARANVGTVPDLDRRIDPCTDFDAFANAPWRAANPIPAQQSRWGRRAAESEANRRDVQALLEELSRRESWPRGSIERLLSEHYASCMDESRIEGLGVAPIAPLLDEIDAVRNGGDLQRSIRRLHALSVPVGFGLLGAMDTHEPRRFIANVVPGALGLSGRDAYLGEGPELVQARDRYRARVARLLVLAGSPEAAAQESSRAILALETRLAQATLDGKAAADPAATDHPTSFAQLEQMAPGIDWKAYFADAGIPRVDLNVEQPGLLRQLDAELRETPLPVWKAYLRWQLLDSAAPFLSTSFAASPGGAPRARRCVEWTESLFGDAVGRKYVERHFPPAAKAKVQEIVRALLTVLKDDVARLDWMRLETRKTALAKLEGYDAQVGYPERWTDYAGVKVHRDTFWANVAAGRKFNVAANRKRIGKPTERDLWQLPASSPGAYIDVQLNQIVLPAGFLRPPAFSLDRTDAENYGAIGTGVAHDLTHAIDVGGSELDVDGRPRPWWTETDRQEFQKRGKCIAEQFEGYSVEPGLHHKGSLVLGEAVGDLAGVRVAFLAFRKSLEGHPPPAREGLSPEQRFFVAFAQSRGDAVRAEALRQMLETDPHPAPRFRVIGTLSNLPEFQQAFSCPAGAEMVRPAEKRCAVW